MITITTERPDHAGAIETLLDAAFGVERHRKISYSYREGVECVRPLCLVAVADDSIAATIRYWPIVIGDTPSLLLGPVAVETGRRNTGLGAMLIRRSLQRAAIIGYRSVILVGDEAYYGRFGFHPAARHGIAMPREEPARVLALPLARPERYSMPSGTISPWRSVRRVALAA